MKAPGDTDGGTESGVARLSTTAAGASASHLTRITRIVTLGPAGTFSERAAQLLAETDPKKIMQAAALADASPRDANVDDSARDADADDSARDADVDASARDAHPAPRHHKQRTPKKADGQVLPIEFERTILSVLTATEQHPHTLGVLPIENSVAGTVIPAQDGLIHCRVQIIAELQLPVNFSLLAPPDVPLEAITHLLAHPQAEAQCQRFIASMLRTAEIQYADSNTAAAARFFQATPAERATLAAIVPLEHGQACAPYLKAERIQDVASNTTRFLAIRKRHPRIAHDYSRQKTSILIEPDRDRPGLLHEVLSVFQAASINLIRLESRPSRQTPWTYVFFVDFQNNAQSAACIQGTGRNQEPDHHHGKLQHRASQKLRLTRYPQRHDHETSRLRGGAITGRRDHNGMSMGPFASILPILPAKRVSSRGTSSPPFSLECPCLRTTPHRLTVPPRRVPLTDPLIDPLIVWGWRRARTCCNMPTTPSIGIRGGKRPWQRPLARINLCW